MEKANLVSLGLDSNGYEIIRLAVGEEVGKRKLYPIFLQSGLPEDENKLEESVVLKTLHYGREFTDHLASIEYAILNEPSSINEKVKDRLFAFVLDEKNNELEIRKSLEQGMKEKLETFTKIVSESSTLLEAFSSPN